MGFIIRHYCVKGWCLNIYSSVSYIRDLLLTIIICYSCIIALKIHQMQF